ncbi:MAG: hypothetical protein MR517_09430 [Bacteroidales bacterium]|nr:hypothetical protein [Bacteroidales bacterium]
MSKKTFNGFIARNSDGALRLFLNRPVRDHGGWSAPRFRGSLELSIEAFEELRWEDEPVAVTLTIES